MQMESPGAGERSLLRIGAVCAVAGAALQVAAGAGAGIGGQPSSGDAEEMLRWLADRPDWYWPAIYFCLLFGALLWVAAFVALAVSLTRGTSWALGRLAVPAIIAGVTLHLVDGALSGVGLRLVADDWAAVSGAEQAAVLRDGETLLALLEGTWASVVSFYHGLPFILMGVAALLSRRYPAWLGWVGAAAGGWSLAVGLAMFASDDVPDPLYLPGALGVSLFMVIAGILLWDLAVQAAPAGNGDRATGGAGADAR